jgi:hypothetical protein
MDLFHPFKRRPQRLPGLWLLVAIVLLSGCEEKKDDGQRMAAISPYNHTADYIHQLYVDGTWGGNSRAYGGGGSFVCCVSYPRIWRSDLTATVRWTTSSSIPGGGAEETWHEQVVPIERYDRDGSLNVHFLADHKVRLLIWPGSAGSPGYRGPAAPIKPANWPYRIKDE